MVSLAMSVRGVSYGQHRRREAPPAARPWWRHDTARGRPPSPLIGAGYVWAMQLIAFGSALLQWACG